ncbi:MAG TPA: UDP-N-acetylmuramoyl-tripeptide--D-alanyl-D-alanine ligase [Terriglobia bacterium]|nr:UDP-N-acetylmuramoyl-tripeptide--D-alanyl-D-alanine ligase [Terriglobia bacterium]
MNLLFDEVAKAVDGTLAGRGDAVVRGYSIDTRTLNAGDLFFAVRGPRFDGHDFIQQAMEKKAAGAVVEAGDFPHSAEFNVVRVRSTVEALQNLARFVRRRWGGPIVGVTGSAGKTTTKEMIAAVLGRKYTVLRSIGNFNNEFGLPLCLLRIDRSQTMAVLEMGMSAKGEIRRLAEIAEPNEGVITNVNPVHLEFFESIEGIAEAKAELLAGLVEPRVAYLNNDDPRVRAMAGRFTGKVVTYGVASDSTFQAHRLRDLGLGGSGFTVRHAGSDTDFILPLLGQHNVANAVAAIAVGIQHGISWSEVRSAIAGIRPEKKRGEVVRFQAGFDVIDDSYNSNPKALTEMIRFLGKLEGYKRKIVVAGEMLELGPTSAELHRSCGVEAARAGTALIVGVQGEARSVLEGAREAGVEDERLKFAANAAEAGVLLARFLQSGDVVLIKGSRGVKLEQVLSALRQSFSSVEA